MTSRSLGRALLVSAALALVGVAAFHASGHEIAAGWLPGRRGAIVETLWLLPSYDWLVAALAMTVCAIRGRRPDTPIACLIAAIPAGGAIAVGSAMGFSFVGVWLLGASSALAAAGAFSLPRPSSSAA